MSDNVVLRGRRWRRLASFVDGTHAELVGHAFLQPGHLELTGIGLGWHQLGPIRLILVQHLNDVVRDGTAAIALGRLPLQRHRLIVVVNDLGLARCIGFV